MTLINEEIARPPTPTRGELARQYRNLTANFLKTMPRPGGPPPPAALPMFKLYPGWPHCDLGYPLPPTLDPTVPFDAWTRLSALLGYTLGLNQLRVTPEQVALYGRKAPGEGFINSIVRRYVPSGGALYPSELYVWLNTGWPEATGFYHYDPAHHGLVRLRTGSFAIALGEALGLNGGELQECSAIIFGSVRLTKNLAKYGDFSYRLQALDHGVVQGRLLALSEVLGWQATVRWQFLDRKLNYLLGLDELIESVYGVLLLDSTSLPTTQTAEVTPLPEVIPPLELPVQSGEEKLKLSPLLETLHRASLAHQLPKLVKPDARPPALTSTPPFDLVKALTSRRSEGSAFDGRPITAQNLLDLARQAYGILMKLAQGDTALEMGLSFLALNVEGLPMGAYLYDAPDDRLKPTSLTTQAVAQLTAANYFVTSFNFQRIAAVFFPTGSYEHSLTKYGDRGFRLLNLAAGSAIEAVQTAARGWELDTANYLGYDISKANALLNLPANQDALMQLFIGQLVSGLPQYQSFLI